MIELKFKRPIEMYTDNDFDGKEYRLQYTIKYVKSDTKPVYEIEYKIIVSISNLLLIRWNYQNENDLFKIFYLFAFQFIKNKLVKGTLNKNEKLVLQTDTPYTDNKYDAQKIEDFIGKIYTLDLDELKRDKEKWDFNSFNKYYK